LNAVQAELFIWSHISFNVIRQARIIRKHICLDLPIKSIKR
jgi:hypothetical protein